MKQPKPDWTHDEQGRSNASKEFIRLCRVVECLIRNDAHALINGHADATARLIMAQLAHTQGMAPRRRKAAE